MARGWFGILFLAAVAGPVAGQSPVAPVDLGPAGSSSNNSGGMLLAPVMTRSGGSTTPYEQPSRPEPIRSLPTSEIRPVSFDPPASPAAPTRAAALAPRADAAPVSSSAFDAPPKPSPPAGAYPLNDLFSPKDKTRTGELTHNTKSFGDRFADAMGSGRAWLCSDREFDYFASPVTNPFLFEDPRSLTEIRPTMIFQKVPSDSTTLQGGNAWFFGTQARLSFTDRLSFTLNKLGVQAFNPGDTSGLNDEYGFAEVWLGPKYTFIRDPECHRLMAGGILFQIPTGSNNVYQDTGSLSIVPYVSYAQSLMNLNCGTLNLMANTGYSIATDSQRSDYWYISGHLDFDIGDHHRFYPLTELNYFLYTKDGQARPGFGAEGRDLANIGANAAGSNLLTWAIGGRVKVSESAQIGAAFELPVIGNRDLFQYRFTVDVIIRF